MRKPRIGKIESRAIAACAKIKEWGEMSFNMEWRKNACWGRVAVICWHGEKAAEASGCGYDKESACLSAFLNPLIEGGVHCNGSGLRSVQDKLSAAGWNLEHTYSGKTEDGYRITRKA